MTTWRSAAFGDTITYDPESDTLLALGTNGEYLPSPAADPATDHVFVELPFEDGHNYTDIGQVLYCCMFRVTANDGSVLSDLEVGHWFPAQLTVGNDDHTDGQILTDFSYSYDQIPAQLAPAGITVVPDGLGALFLAADPSITVEDFGPVDPPSPTPHTWRSLAFGDTITYDPESDLTLDPDGAGTYRPGTEYAFVELPLVDGHLYTDLGYGNLSAYSGLIEVVGNDGSTYPDFQVGDLLVAQLTSSASQPLDFSLFWDIAVDGFAPFGLTLAQRALGIMWRPGVITDPFTVEDLGVPAPPDDPPTDPPADPTPPAPLRHRTRHLHRTLVDHAHAILDATDWFDTPPTNFASVNTYPVTLIDYEPQMLGETPAFNTVAVSLGDEGEDTDWELGNFSKVVRIPVFFDVYPVNEPIGVAIADDLKVGLVDLVLPLRDYTASPAVDTIGLIELEHVVVEKLQSTVMDKRSWRCVKAVATLYPNGWGSGG